MIPSTVPKRPKRGVSPATGPRKRNPLSRGTKRISAAARGHAKSTGPTRGAKEMTRDNHAISREPHSPPPDRRGSMPDVPNGQAFKINVVGPRWARRSGRARPGHHDRASARPHRRAPCSVDLGPGSARDTGIRLADRGREGRRGAALCTADLNPTERVVGQIADNTLASPWSCHWYRAKVKERQLIGRPPHQRAAPRSALPARPRSETSAQRRPGSTAAR